MVAHLSCECSGTDDTESFWGRTNIRLFGELDFKLFSLLLCCREYYVAGLDVQNAMTP